METVVSYESFKADKQESAPVRLNDYAIAERGINVDHSTLNRWVIKYAPLFEYQARKIKKPVASSWRMDETYINVKG